MSPADREAFLEIVLGLAELFGKDLSPQALELYWRAMQAWSLREFRAAAELLLRRSAFMPKPADFEQLRRAGQPGAGEAWPRVLEHCRGAYRGGRGLDDGGPIDLAVSAIGGYRAIAFYDVAYLGVLERRFAERYDQAVDAAAVREAVPALPMSHAAAIKSPDR